MKEFSKWTIEEVEETFQLIEAEQNEWLTAWQTAEIAITPDEDAVLTQLCLMLQQHVHDWNEEELKMYFIGSLMRLVDYLHKEYQAFFDRSLTATFDGERLKGVVDCVIAKGRRSPKRPIFCLHEYKPKCHASNDPLGQVAVAMVAAQRMNQDDKPIYGAYIIGGFWYFLVLHQNAYAESVAYDATQPDGIRQIFKMLKYIKQLVEQELRG